MTSTRRYHSPRRAQQAAATRQAILDAARASFTADGYAATTVAAIARAAGVATDTVYAAIGRKPLIIRELVETAISGADGPVPPDQREYVARMRATDSAAEKLEIYADAVAAMQPRLAPLVTVLRDAAATDADCAALWDEIGRRRAENMRALAADLRSTGEVRADLDDDAVADVIWSMNAPEYWQLLVDQRGWTGERVGRWLADAWTRLLLAPVHSRP